MVLRCVGVEDAADGRGDVDGLVRCGPRAHRVFPLVLSVGVSRVFGVFSLMLVAGFVSHVSLFSMLDVLVLVSHVLFVATMFMYLVSRPSMSMCMIGSPFFFPTSVG